MQNSDAPPEPEFRDRTCTLEELLDSNGPIKIEAWPTMHWIADRRWKEIVDFLVPEFAAHADEMAFFEWNGAQIWRVLPNWVPDADMPDVIINEWPTINVRGDETLKRPRYPHEDIDEPRT